ncbi:MAG: hypothetical protein Q4A62_00425 [Eikenella sp.]|nr:hypothetical protein [Eikenella sp.]
MRAETLRLWAARPVGALLIGLGLSVIPTACGPEPEPVPMTAEVLPPEPWETEISKLRAVYAQMDDLERMAGVVYEPADEQGAEQ